MWEVAITLLGTHNGCDCRSLQDKLTRQRKLSVIALKWTCGCPSNVSSPVNFSLRDAYSHFIVVTVVIQALSCGWLFVTPWTKVQQASLSFTISWSLLKLMSIELVMLSINLILCFSLHLLPLIFPSIRVFFLQWVGPSHSVTKILELQLQHQSFQWIFRVDFLQDWLVWPACSPRDS